MREGVWTPAEEERLIALRAVGLPWHIVAKKLGRTEAATVSRAGMLKLRRLSQRAATNDTKRQVGLGWVK
jgi:hypothetical protein